MNRRASAKSVRLLHRVYRVSLRLEQGLYKLLIPGAGMPEIAEGAAPLSLFVRSHWRDAEMGTMGTWRSYPAPAERWYYATFTANEKLGGKARTIQIDTLRGSFLVDGQPMARLPDEITSNDVYIRVFGDVVLDVQPGAKHGEYVTARQHQGSTFTFSRNESTNEVGEVESRIVIQDRRAADDGSYRDYELVPHFKFGDGGGREFPRRLIDGYSHWLDTFSCTRSPFPPPPVQSPRLT
jgi:hypothetical protein